MANMPDHLLSREPAKQNHVSFESSRAERTKSELMPYDACAASKITGAMGHPTVQDLKESNRTDRTVHNEKVLRQLIQLAWIMLKSATLVAAPDALSTTCSRTRINAATSS